MDFFEKYVSNTSAGTCNNSILSADEPFTVTGRICYKVAVHGRFNYRFYFINTVDSTYDNGSKSWANRSGGHWDVVSAYAGDSEHPLKQLSFDGRGGKHVTPDERFWCDEVTLDIESGHYLVFEWTVRGNDIPYTPDKIIPSFVKKNGEYISSVEFPQPVFVGCERKVTRRVAFLGDSITQGLGTRVDYYEHWVADIARLLGDEYAVWNIGLGFGRASDAATDGSWLDKAKHMDAVSVCFGVNDIFQGRTKEQLCGDLKKIIMTLNGVEVKTGIFTIPPFSMTGKDEDAWRYVNEYIGSDIAPLTAYCFDTSTVLGLDKPRDNMARYGEHPDGNGGAALAREFVGRKYIERII